MNDQRHAHAVTVAKLYYYQGLTTEQIANELGLSRPAVSRLLSFAKQQGMVQITINDSVADMQSISETLKKKYKLKAVHTVPVPDNADEANALERVGTFAGMYLNTLIKPGTVLGVAWGTTLAAITRHLIPKPTPDVTIVQLNGSGNIANISSRHISEVILTLAQNFGANAHLFPVPAFFDYPETKAALWRERSVKQIIELHRRASVMMYSIGAVNSKVPSLVYSAGYLEQRDRKEMDKEGVIGDISTVFFRADGTFDDIPINRRASGLDLALIHRVPTAVCVVAGRSKVHALRGALAGRLMNELIVDEPTARLLLD